MTNIRHYLVRDKINQSDLMTNQRDYLVRAKIKQSSNM